MTEYESWSLLTQVITTVATAAAVVVALVFGWLTLANSRRSKDNQDRATFAAASLEAPISAEFAEVVVGLSRVNWEVSHQGGENFLLRNAGSETAHGVAIFGLTDGDKERLVKAAGDIGSLGPTEVVGFVYTSRFTRSGPGNIVVAFSLNAKYPSSDRITRVVRVPAP